MTDPITTVTKPLSASSEYCEDDCASTAVVDAVAEADGVSPIAVQPPLYSVLDPDALDQIFAASGTDALGSNTGPDHRFGDDWTPTELSFAYAGYDVTVTSTRDEGISVSVRET